LNFHLGSENLGAGLTPLHPPVDKIDIDILLLVKKVSNVFDKPDKIFMKNCFDMT
jgi:hypothetical protein